MSEDRKEVIVRGDGEGLHHEVFVGSHRQAADEPLQSGGSDRGPNPYDILLASLGSCTAMTLTMYAQRKGLPLRGVTTRLRHSRIHADDCAECETEEGRIDSIVLTIGLEGPLSDEQRSKLLEIARKCPVHRTLTSEKVIELGPGGESGQAPPPPPKATGRKRRQPRQMLNAVLWIFAAVLLGETFRSVTAPGKARTTGPYQADCYKLHLSCILASIP